MNELREFCVNMLYVTTTVIMVTLSVRLLFNLIINILDEFFDE